MALAASKVQLAPMGCEVRRGLTWLEAINHFLKKGGDGAVCA